MIPIVFWSKEKNQVSSTVCFVKFGKEKYQDFAMDRFVTKRELKIFCCCVKSGEEK